MLTDHLMMSEPGKQRDTSKAARPPRDGVLLGAGGDPAPQPGHTPQGPTAQQNRGRARTPGLLPTELSTRSEESIWAFGPKSLLSTFKVRNAALALTVPGSGGPADARRDYCQVLDHRLSEATEGP